MFEKFTEKAINAVTEAQEQAKLMHNAHVQPEHLLLAIVKQAKGVSLKLFRTYDVSYETIQKEVENKLRFEKSEKNLAAVPFSDEFKNLLKNTLDLANKSGNQYVLFEHLFLSAINETSYNKRILEKLEFDINNTRNILSRMVQKKSKKLSHPEIEDAKETEAQNFNTENLFKENENISRIFESAYSKLSESKYEILGTEQIIAAILEDKDSDVTKVLQGKGLSCEDFEQKLSQITSRQAEYDEKKVVFTPSAFAVMDYALQTAKELGSLQIKPEHIILGLLKSKKGVAYDVFKDLNINDADLAEEILKPIEKQMPQAIAILRLAKQEARRLGRNIVGTEMILLGIVSEGTGVGFKVLNDLEISLKDVRQAVEGIIGYGNEYFDKEIVFTKRAKKVLEVAWEKAKKYNRPRILSEHLLYAITTERSSVAMKALEQLGVDAVEIRQGILKEIGG
jgi:ATP-dependent Clp protease ATP-binding subunit ClpA